MSSASFSTREEKSFIVPPDRPFFEPLTCLAFLAGRTEKIKLGVSVLVLPYRHPLYWAKAILDPRGGYYAIGLASPSEPPPSFENALAGR